MTDTDRIKVGFISIIRTTFDVELAQEVTAQAKAQLRHAGFVLTAPDETISSLEAAQRVANTLASEPLDLLIVLQATFADSTMIQALAEKVDTPLVLWAVPEEHTGGRLRLNSLCGVNLAGHALKRAGYDYHYLYAMPDDSKAIDNLQIFARAAYVRRRLQTARLGRMGENPAGFETCLVNPNALREQVGVEVVQFDLQRDVFAAVQAVDSGAVQVVRDDLSRRVDGLDDVETDATNGTLGTYVVLRELADRDNLNGFAVRCWPEFFTEMDCAACAASSMLSDAMLPSSCEADVNGTVTQMMLQWLSDEPAFGTDIVSLDEERDALVLWHCGLAPLSMADPDETPSVTIHSNRAKPLLMQFALKPGRVTVARLSETTGAYRLVVGNGEMIRGAKSFSGTSGLLRFDRPARDVLDTLISEGLEHHISITYGDHVPALLVLAQMLDLPILRL
ncbi:MAG: fucose isomerase [Chloroflexi bacterium]|nr:MAG: fucose isomerase [Chloroflexota bacterium]